MHFLSGLAVPVLSLALSTYAAPLTSTNEAQVLKRALPPAPGTGGPKASVVGTLPTKVVCTGGAKTRSYQKADIVAAVQRAQQYIDAGTVGLAGNPPVASKGYPHDFNNNEGFTFPACPVADLGQLQEFPILNGGKTFRSQPTDVNAGNGAGLPGPDRVIFFAQPEQEAVRFCGVITHDGPTDTAGGFNLCN